MARSPRYVVPAAAAAGVALAVVLFWPAGHGGKAYGMSDVCALLRHAQTIHMKGIFYEYGDMAKPDVFTRQAFEAWFDMVGGRTWQRSTAFAGDSEGPPVNVTETVCGGDYTMVVDHTAKSVRFDRVSPYLRTIQTRQAFDAMLRQMLGDPRRLDGFVLLRQDQIDGRQFNVWQREVAVHPGVMNLRVQWWLAPDSGKVGCVKTWNQVLPVGEQWYPSFTIDTLERDAAVPTGLFTTEPPAGYRLENKKEDTTTPELDLQAGVRVDRLEFDARIAFVLPDGSVLLAWRGIDHDEPGSQEELFKDLSVGGPLPKLAVEAYALGQLGADKAETHIGRHLAVTRKGDKYIEWGLYVALDPTSASRMQMYRVLVRFNPPDRKVAGQMLAGLLNLLAVDSAEDFDVLVRGAMAELSDSGTAPPHVTYEQVLDLAERIRASQTSQGQDPSER